MTAMHTPLDIGICETHGKKAAIESVSASNKGARLPTGWPVISAANATLVAPSLASTEPDEIRRGPILREKVTLGAVLGTEDPTIHIDSSR